MTISHQHRNTLEFSHLNGNEQAAATSLLVETAFRSVKNRDFPGLTCLRFGLSFRFSSENIGDDAMSAALYSLFASAGLAAILAQNQPPATTTPPASPLGQPAPTTTVPQAGVTINAATGALVTTPASGVGTPTNAAGTALAPTNALPAGAADTRPGTAGASTNRSKITPVQLQNINRLAIDLNGLGLATRDPVEQQRGLIETLKTAPIASIRPSPESITKLGESVAAVVPSLALTAPQRRQLAIDLNLALNSGNLTPVEAQRVIADARGILQRSAAQNPDGVDRLLGALSGVVAEVQASVAQAAPGQNEAGTAPASTPAALQTPAPNSSQTEAGQSAGSQTGQGSGGSPPEPQP